MNITIYTITFNEELLIQFMIDHYRSRFPDCHIIVYDNSSTDKTVEISKANGCEVRTYDSGNTLDDGLHMYIKNTCWKDAKTEWVLMCDLDEMLDINFQELYNEQNAGSTIIRTEAWSLINMEDNYDLKNMKYGFRHPMYDKSILFNKNHINEINYGAGCHDCNPIGNVNYSNKLYKIYHYKYININLIIEKCKLTANRLSVANKKNNWGNQCLRSEKNIREDFENVKIKSIKILQ